MASKRKNKGFLLLLKCIHKALTVAGPLRYYKRYINIANAIEKSISDGYVSANHKEELYLTEKGRNMLIKTKV